jgi:hypothetical protein
VDPTNRVVQLCGEGMQAEARNKPEAARALFEQAWAEAQDDYDACVAAHYVARHQDTLADALDWNQRALRHAQAVSDERVAGFFASLHLNLGKSYEDLNEDAKAAAQYELAEQSLAAVADGDYGDVVRGGVAAARTRLRER